MSTYYIVPNHEETLQWTNQAIHRMKFASVESAWEWLWHRSNFWGSESPREAFQVKQ